VALPALFGPVAWFEFTDQRSIEMSIAEQMKEIIAEKLSVDIEDVTPQASFVEDLGADSLDLVELIMTMEEAFNIDISDEDAGKLVTVQDAIQYVGAH